MRKRNDGGLPVLKMEEFVRGRGYAALFRGVGRFGISDAIGRRVKQSNALASAHSRSLLVSEGNESIHRTESHPRSLFMATDPFMGARMRTPQDLERWR